MVSTRSPKVTAGFFSFTEVEAGEHHSYNEWHLYDHQPEQFVLPGIAWGQRWVLPPAQRARASASPPLDRTHYVTLYLLAEPLDQTLADFMALGRCLAEAGRFHLKRTSHLAGPLAVSSLHAAPRVAVGPEAVPYRPGTGAHVRVLPAGAESGRPEALLDVPGVAGAWTFAGGATAAGPLADLQVVWCWLDGDPMEVAAVLDGVAPRPPHDARVWFTGTLETVDPSGPWDWFDR